MVKGFAIYDTSAKTIYVPIEAYDAYTQSTSYKINTTTSAIIEAVRVRSSS